MIISNIMSLKKEKKKVLEGLEASEVEVYVENLTRNLYLSFVDSDVESMKKYSNQISEVSEILQRKYNLDDFIVSTDKKIANQYLVYYKTKLELIILVGFVKDLLKCYSDLHEDYILLYDLIQLQKKFFLELAIHRDVDVVERLFSEGNNTNLQFNKIVNDLKCKVTFELSDLKKELLIFDDVSIGSIIENYEKASSDIENHDVLKDTGILEEILLTNQFLESVSNIVSESKGLLNEIEDFIQELK